MRVSSACRATLVAILGGVLLHLHAIPTAAAATTTITLPGLDSCAAPAVSQMRAFWDRTPYWWWNIYIGGTMRGCQQANLSGSWVTQVRGIGWRLLPTWVGPQAPCSGYRVRFAYDPATAYNQGRNEAAAAFRAIIGLGMNSDTPIVYDLEGFNTADGACVRAAREFVHGWTDYLAIPPRQVSGVYGSTCASAINSYATIARPPDFIWGAWYNNDPNVNNMICVNPGYWVHHQRHKQYRGGHPETWNGVTLSVDNDSSDGPVYQ